MSEPTANISRARRDLRAAPVVDRSPAAARVVCSGCGSRGRTGREVADLEVSWLVPASRAASAAVGFAVSAVAADGLVEARFCRGCAPRGRVEDIACAACGDGPLLADELIDPDLTLAAAIDAWLERAGWRSAGPWCPACSTVVRPRR